MPEANVLTPYEQEPHWLRNRRFRNTVKKYVPRGDEEASRGGWRYVPEGDEKKRFVRIRGEQLSKAGLVTGVKS